MKFLVVSSNVLLDFAPSRDRDGSLRIRQIKIIGQYAITFWVDNPVKTVMVVGVQRADE